MSPGKPDDSPTLANLSLRRMLRRFVLAVDACDWDTADAQLAIIFGLQAWEARPATRYYADQLDQESDLLLRTLRIRTAVACGERGQVLTLLASCLGLTGSLAHRALDHLEQLDSRRRAS